MSLTVRNILSLRVRWATAYWGYQGFEKSTRNAKILWTVFLALQDPMRPGAKATVTTPTGETLGFTYDPAVPSPLFKVNQVGYSTLAAKRYAYLGGWLGPLGPWPAPPD